MGTVHVSLCDIDDVLRKIDQELSMGNAKDALGYAQCLWCFCGSEQELRERLEYIRTELVPPHRHRLTLDERHWLNLGLYEAAVNACRPDDQGRCLLAASAA